MNATQTGRCSGIAAISSATSCGSVSHLPRISSDIVQLRILYGAGVMVQALTSELSINPIIHLVKRVADHLISAIVARQLS